jgi:hypothetical protein
MGFFRKKSQPKVSDSLVKSKSSQEIDIRNSDNNGKRGEVIIHQPPWKVPTIHDKVSASSLEKVTFQFTDNN